MADYSEQLSFGRTPRAIRIPGVRFDEQTLPKSTLSNVRATQHGINPGLDHAAHGGWTGTLQKRHTGDRKLSDDFVYEQTRRSGFSLTQSCLGTACQRMLQLDVLGSVGFDRQAAPQLSIAQNLSRR